MFTSIYASILFCHPLPIAGALQSTYQFFKDMAKQMHNVLAEVSGVFTSYILQNGVQQV